MACLEKTDIEQMGYSSDSEVTDIEDKGYKSDTDADDESENVLKKPPQRVRRTVLPINNDSKSDNNVQNESINNASKPDKMQNEAYSKVIDQNGMDTAGAEQNETSRLHQKRKIQPDDPDAGSDNSSAEKRSPSSSSKTPKTDNDCPTIGRLR
ncbi:hypothetical protein FPQ18DRAFT_303614 [Pyronema domesticum]|nr:hypothetical protein FPQ18DRAFT_303614 [Pyronema domesticum]